MKHNDSSRLRLLVFFGLLTGVLGSLVVPYAFAQNTSALTNALCGIVNGIGTVLSILALLMFILGGTLYAFAHFLPATGNFRGNMQGWGMGMLMGGIIALVLYIIAPFIVGQIIGINNANNNNGINTGTGNNASVNGLSNATCAGVTGTS